MNTDIFEAKLNCLDKKLNERVKRKKLSQSDKNRLFIREYAAFNKRNGGNHSLSLEMRLHKKKAGTIPHDEWFKKMCEIRGRERGAMTVGQFTSLKKSLQK